MLIEQTNNFLPLLKACLEQPDLIEKLSIQVKDGFVTDTLHMLLKQDRWPFAVDPSYLADPNSEADKISRAENIVSIILPSQLQNKRFLDFGCGEGHVANTVATRGSAISVGYDIVAQNWSTTTPDLLLTTDWSDVVAKGPYDVVLLYDVLDHIVDSDWVEELKKVDTVLSAGGLIFARCHPWCSRHATHLYHKMNKAYMHLIFSEEDLKTMGYQGLPTRKVTHPLRTYEELFKNAGLKIVSEPWITREHVENFFEEPSFRERIIKHWSGSYDPALARGETFPHYQMEQQFLDYILTKA